MHFYTYDEARGIASEERVEKALKQMVGQCLVEKRKKGTLMRRILDFFHAKPNDELDRSHADFDVKVESDIHPELSVKIQVKSSLKSGLRFERKCRLNRWGPIQSVVVEDEDSDETVLQKVKNALIKGYNAVRRELCKKLWHYGDKVMRKMGFQDNRRRRQKIRQEWCIRFNQARMCAH